MYPPPNPRHSIIRSHLDAYEKEGADIQSELSDIAFQRKRITENPSIRLTFGQESSGHLRPDYYERENNSFSRPIVLTSGNDKAPTSAPSVASGTDRNVLVARDCSGASAIAYPGLKACLLMWLDQREAHARKALAAWEARDAVAEAVALLSDGSVETA